MIAGALAVEMVAALLHHPEKFVFLITLTITQMTRINYKLSNCILEIWQSHLLPKPT